MCYYSSDRRATFSATPRQTQFDVGRTEIAAVWHLTRDFRPLGWLGPTRRAATRGGFGRDGTLYHAIERPTE